MASFKFNNIYINDYVTLAGQKEKNGKLTGFDLIIDDYYCGENTFELAEIKMQKMVTAKLLNQNHLADSNIDFLIGGDLINQIAISSYNAKNYRIPFVGVYAACATFPESLLLAGNLLQNEDVNKIVCVTSSHNLTAERQYRYPVEYGATKASTATSTATAAISALVSKDKSNIKIKGGTFGKVVDLGVNDINHMGAVMAPACANTLFDHLHSFKRKPNYYDLILTGDLGGIGLEIFKEYYEKEYKEKLQNVKDAGSEIYYDNQEMFSGGSGPCCLPLVFFCKIIKSGKYKKILLLGSGSLHTPALVNQQQTIPSICHAVEIEVLK